MFQRACRFLLLVMLASPSLPQLAIPAEQRDGHGHGGGHGGSYGGGHSDGYGHGGGGHGHGGYKPAPCHPQTITKYRTVYKDKKAEVVNNVS